MKVSLIFPPQGHFTQPYLSLPSLTAWLRMHGIEEVSQLDVNIEAYEHILSRKRLLRSIERVRADTPACESLLHPKTPKPQNPNINIHDRVKR